MHGLALFLSVSASPLGHVLMALLRKEVEDSAPCGFVATVQKFQDFCALGRRCCMQSFRHAQPHGSQMQLQGVSR